MLTSTPLDDVPGGGESRLRATERFVRGYRALLDRPEERIAVVAHGAPVRYVLLALDGRPPIAVLEQVEPAQAFTVDAEALGRAIDVLEAWAASPAW